MARTTAEALPKSQGIMSRCRAKFAKSYALWGPSSQSRQMQTTTISFTNMHVHGELLAISFAPAVRVSSFRIIRDLPQAEGMEFDQYDTRPRKLWR